VTCNRYQREASHHLLARHLTSVSSVTGYKLCCNGGTNAVEGWCVPSTAHVPCTYLSITVFVAILESHLAMAALNGLFMRAAGSRGYPQVGILSPLLWCLVADEMIERLNKGWHILKVCWWHLPLGSGEIPKHGVGAHAVGPPHHRNSYLQEKTSWFLWTSFLWSYLALFYVGQASWVSPEFSADLERASEYEYQCEGGSQSICGIEAQGGQLNLHLHHSTIH